MADKNKQPSMFLKIAYSLGASILLILAIPFLLIYITFLELITPIDYIIFRVKKLNKDIPYKFFYFRSNAIKFFLKTRSVKAKYINDRFGIIPLEKPLVVYFYDEKISIIKEIKQSSKKKYLVEFNLGRKGYETKKFDSLNDIVKDELNPIIQQESLKDFDLIFAGSGKLKYDDKYLIHYKKLAKQLTNKEESK